MVYPPPLVPCFDHRPKALLTRHQLDQLEEEGREPAIRLIESVLDYIEQLRHDSSNRQRRHIADLSGHISKLTARLKRAKDQLAKQLCLNCRLKRRIAELEAATVVKDSHNSSLPPSIDPPAEGGQRAKNVRRSSCRPSGRRPGGQPDRPGSHQGLECAARSCDHTCPVPVRGCARRSLWAIWSGATAGRWSMCRSSVRMSPNIEH